MYSISVLVVSLIFSFFLYPGVQHTTNADDFMNSFMMKFISKEIFFKHLFEPLFVINVYYMSN